MSDEIAGVTAESPPATETPTETPPAQAPSQPVSGQSPRTVPLDAHIALRREFQAFKRAVEEQEAARRQPPPDNDKMAALAALKELHGLDPDLKNIPAIAQKIDQLERAVTQLLGSHRTGLVASGRQTITETAARLGVPADKLEKAVLGFLADDPALYQRFAQGDLATVREVLKDLEDNVFGKLKREAASALGQTKLTTTQLPRPGAGSMPGEPAHKPLSPNASPEEVRAYKRGMFSDGRRMLRELTEG